MRVNTGGAVCGVRASGKSKHLGTAELDTNGTERIDDGVWQSYVQQLIMSCKSRGSRQTYYTVQGTGG